MVAYLLTNTFAAVRSTCVGIARICLYCKFLSVAVRIKSGISAPTDLLIMWPVPAVQRTVTVNINFNDIETGGSSGETETAVPTPAATQAAPTAPRAAEPAEAATTEAEIEILELKSEIVRLREQLRDAQRWEQLQNVSLWVSTGDAGTRFHLDNFCGGLSNTRPRKVSLCQTCLRSRS